MATVLVTGATDGIGAETARALVAGGHRVVVHARNDERAVVARDAVVGAAGVVVGDAESLAQVRSVAEQAVAVGPYDAVIHNVGVGAADRRSVTADGFERIFQVNVLTPYLLTCLMPRPHRLVYLTSGLEANGEADIDDLHFERKPWDGFQAYSDSKLHDVMLAFAVARLSSGTASNAVDPGWIKTRMGGPGATDELPEGAETQVRLATSDEAAAVTGRYLKRRKELRARRPAHEVARQVRLLSACAAMTGAVLPS